MSQVLIATATYGHAMRPETRRSVGDTIFDGGWQWHQSRHNPFPAPHRGNWLAQYQHIRERVLSEAWDAVLLVEHDMQIPPDAMQKLWDTGAPVAYGVYLLRHGAYVLNAYEYIGNGAIGQSLTYHADALAAAWGQGVVRVSAIGFGCTLIRREVLEAIPFRAEVDHAPDMPFAQDCEAAGVVQVAHFGVICGHWDDMAKKMIAPAQNDTGARKAVRALRTMVVGVNGSSVPVTRGEVYQMPYADALELIRGGYMEAIEEKGNK